MDDESPSIVPLEPDDNRSSLQHLRENTFAESSESLPVPPENGQEAQKIEKKRHLLGICCVIGVVIIWVASSNLIQSIFQDFDFNKPFFLTYFSTSLFSVYLFGFFKKEWRAMFWASPCFRSSEYRDLDETQPSTVEKKIPKYSVVDVIKVAAMFCPIWFFANWSFNASLNLTSVTSNTILSTTSGLFTLFIGTVFRADHFSLVKLIAAVTSFFGVVLVAFEDGQSESGPSEGLFGDGLALLSAFLYGCYCVFLKKKVPDEEGFPTPMFFGILGVLNVLFFSLGFLFLDIFSIENFQLPSSQVVGFLVLNGLLGTVTSDLLWLWAVMYTSPLIATLGISLTTAFALVVDWLWRGERFGFFYFLGMISVIAGFFLVNLDELITPRLNEKVLYPIWGYLQEKFPFLKREK